MTPLENWEKKRKKLLEAKKWKDLEGQIDKSGLPVRLSQQRSTPPQLVMTGRLDQYPSHNHASNDALNEAVLQYIITNWKSISNDVLKIMEQDEAEALIEAEAEITKLQNALTAAKQESTK